MNKSLLTPLIFILFSFNLFSQAPFITTWETTSADENVTIPTDNSLFPYNYTVDWGDGVVESGFEGNASHEYSTAGVYTISISGQFPYLANSRSKQRQILTIEQWGDIEWRAMAYSFLGCSKLTYNATDVPDLSRVNNLFATFNAADAFDGDLSGWDVSNITNMANTFSGASSFNGDISTWDVSSVTNMYRMFSNANSFNQDLSSWDVSSVDEMFEMFHSADVFNSDISGWNVGSATDMGGMFEDARAFNQDLSSWDVGQVTNMADMFREAILFDQDLSEWNVSKVENMSNMFYSASAFKSDLSLWDVSSVTNMQAMFRGTPFNSDIGGWNVSAVRNMANMFRDNYDFNQNLGNWSVNAVENMVSMFQNASAFAGDLSSWDVSKVSNMNSMFAGASKFNSDIGGWNVSGVIGMRAMFLSATDFNQDISSWDVSKIRDFSQMFQDASTFNQDIGNWDMSLATNLNSMFRQASAFNGDISAWNVSNVKNFESLFSSAAVFNQDISDWDVSSATNMSQMFRTASAFNADISNWDVSSVQDFSYMFNDSDNFNQNLANWDITNVTTMRSMFEGAASFNGNISQWDVSAVRSFYNMLNGASSFNQSLGSWDISSAISIDGFFIANTGLSVENYDATLQGWAALDNLPTHLTIVAAGLKYCLGETARNTLVNTKSWNISADSKECGNLVPTDIQLSNVNITEGNPSDVVIGQFSTEDRNQNDTHTYNLVAGTGDQDNGLFSISGSELLINSTADFNTKSNYAIRIQTNDGNGGIFNKEFTIQVLKETLLDFAAISSKTFGDNDFVLQASSNSSSEISFSSSDNSIASVSGNRVKIISAGEVTITARQSATAEFSSAQVDNQLTIQRAEQSIVHAIPSTINYQDSIIVGASNNSFLPISFATSDSNILSLYDPVYKDDTDITIILRPGFDPELVRWTLRRNGELVAENNPLGTSDFAEVSRDLTLVDGDYSFIITGVNRTDIAIMKGSEILFDKNDIYDAVGTEFTIQTETYQRLAAVGAGSVNIEINSEGNQNYLPKQSIHTITVNRLAQTLDFPAIGAKTIGDAPFQLVENSSAGLPITYTSSDANVATISGNTVTINSAGTAEISASQEGNEFYVPLDNIVQTLTVNKVSQSITFGSIPDKEYGDAPFALEASASSGLDISYSVSDQSVATVDGNTLTILTAGSVTVTANQSGNDIYASANSASRILRIDKAGQSLASFEDPGTKRFGDAPFTLNATATSGLPVSFSSGDESIFTVEGNVVTIVGAGSATLITSQPGNENYWGFSSYRTLTVSKAIQSITFEPLLDKTFGDDSFELNVTAGDSGNPVQFTSSDPTVATVSGNTVTITGAGIVEITASQTGNDNYNAASDVRQELTVNKANQIIEFQYIAEKNYGDPAFDLLATGGSSGEEVLFSSSDETVATVSGSTVSIVGPGNANITASQAGNTNFESADDVVQELVINRGIQNISFSALSDKTYGDAAFELTATSDVELPVIYESSDESVATITDNTVTILSAGTTNIIASQNGNENYLAADDVVQELTVLKAGQNISFDALQDKTYGDASFNLTATTDSGLPITYTSSDATVATITDNTVTILSGGTTNITASQTGNDNYLAADAVVQEFTVNKADQSISFDAFSDRVFGDVAFELSATTDSGLPVIFESSDETVASIADNMVTILTAGTTIITVSQSGNENYNPAADVNQELVINKADQEITVEEIENKEVDGPDFDIVASIDSGLDLTYSVLSGPANLNGNVVSLTGEAGTVEIEVSQSGNLNFNPTSAVVDFDVIDLCAGFTATTTVVQNVICNADTNGIFEVSVSNGNGPFTYKVGNESQDNGLFENQAAGNYEITVTDANGCAATAFVEITQPSPIEVTAEIMESNTTNGNGSITLTVAGGNGNYSYEWSNGATEPKLTGLSIGDYSVTISDEENCSITETFVVGGVTSNVNEIESLVTIYPNPTNDDVNITHPSTVKLIKLYDAYGRLIEQKLSKTSQTVFHIKSLASGLYFIQLDNGKLNRIVKK